MKYLLVLIVFGFFSGQSFALDDAFEAYVKKHMTEHNIPGVAIVVVDDKKVLYAKGFGLRDVEKGLPMTPDTMSAIASITKSFGTTSFAKLVDQGKADWHTPVRQYLGDFRLKDSYASHWATPIDLMAHRTGSARHDFVLWTGKFTADEAYSMLPQLEMATSFRRGFLYTNTMYMVAGRLVGHLAGEPWASFAKRELLDPLGMNRTVFTTDEFKADDNHAKPYASSSEEAPRFMFYTNADETGAAGQMYSTANDLGKWLQFHMRKGLSHNETQVVSPESIMNLHATHVSYGSYRTDEFQFNGYGLGWSVSTYRGEKMIRHSGSRFGAVSHIGFIAEKNVGVAVLFNSWGGSPNALYLQAIDRLIKKEPIDWMERWYGHVPEEEEQETTYLPTPLSPEKYSGTFANTMYGDVSIQHVNGQLLLHFGGQPNFFIHGPLLLKHKVNNVFEIQNMPWRNTIQFMFDTEGSISGFHWQLESRTPTPVIFVKKAEKRSTKLSDVMTIVRPPKTLRPDWL